MSKNAMTEKKGDKTKEWSTTH